MLRLASIVSLLLATASAHAQAVPADRDAEGRALFQAGLTAYQAGRYEDALGHFRAAYAATPRPELLYNVGQAADRARRDAEAIAAFREYLRLVPNSDRRAAVETRIATLERGGGRGSMSVWPWIVGGAGLALIAIGLPMVLVASADADAIAQAPDGSRWADYEGAYDRVEPLSLAGQSLTIAGAAIAAAGVAWLVIDLVGGGDSGASASLRISPWGAAIGGRL